MFLNTLLLICGLLLLVKGADFFINGASAVAKRFKIPEIIIGLTIVALGTSAPEVSVSVGSALKGLGAVAIGNVLGSNIINVLLILGLTSSICALRLQKNSVKYEIPFLIFITIVLAFVGFYFHNLNRIFGLLLLLLFSSYLIYLFIVAKNTTNSDNSEVEKKQQNLLVSFCFIILGLSGLVYGSNLTIDSAISIAKVFEISDRVIGLTVVAIGTSLPELVTCVVAAIKKQPDIAIGNIVGSNIFNILFVLGVTIVINPVNFEKSFLFDALVGIVSIILLFAFTVFDRKLNRIEGLSFLVIYIFYLIYLLAR